MSTWVPPSNIDNPGVGSECNILDVDDDSRPRAVLTIPRAFSKDYTDVNAGWSELRKICSESSMELLRQQPVFQAGDVAESSGEYELLNALRQHTKAAKEEEPGMLIAEEIKATETKAEPQKEEETKRRPFDFKDIREDEPILIKKVAHIHELSPKKIIEEKKEESSGPGASELAEEGSKPEKASSTIIKPEDKFAGGRAEINFDLAYDYEQYYS